MFTTRFGRKTGFTLVELLVVVLIIGILSAIGVPQYRRSIERSRASEALTMMRSLYDSCERWAWEKSVASCASATARADFSLKKLDVTAKGTYSGTKAFIGNNFTYTLGTSPVVTATPNSNRYSGSYITFNGQTFGCVGTEACKVWGSVSWNQ